MPAISVIVPVYKVEPFIHRCVDSILAQTFTDYELILVDDGSPDMCPDICDEYAQKDSRVHVIHQDNGGLSVARNSGIEWALSNSNSQWLTFVDSDDWIHPEYLQALYQAVCETGCNISMCFYKETAIEEIAEEDISDVELWSPEDAYSLKHKGPTFAYAWGRLYKKELFKELRFPEGKYWEDMFTTHIIIFAESQITVVPYELYYYFINPEGIVRKEWTPQKWGAVEAREGLVSFFKTNHYPWLLQENFKAYVSSLYSAIQNTKDNPNYRNYYMTAIQKLITVINEIDEVYPFEQNINIINSAVAVASFYARKCGIYNQIKKEYRLSVRQATKVLVDEWGLDSAEYFVYQFYPNYIKGRSIMRKIKSMIIRA